MNLRIVPLEEAKDEYRTALRRANNATVFHTVEWLECIHQALNGRVYIGFAEDFAIPLFVKGKPPFRRVFSLPYDTYGGPLVRRNQTVSIDALYAPLDWVRIVDYRTVVSEAKRFRALQWVTHVIYLRGGMGEVQDRYTGSLKKALKQAKRRGLDLETLRDPSELRVFYQLYLQTAKRNKLPVYPYRLFREIFERMVPKGYATFYLARHELEAVAGLLVLKDHNMALAWVDGYKEEALPLRPMNALIDKSIRDAARLRLNVYNLGSTPTNRPGIVKFKESFGAVTYHFTVFEHLPVHQTLARWILRKG